MTEYSGSISGPVNRWGYRPHLDGMRAVAVYLVVLFHSGSLRFSGGFVGVDLFFVLSGFLVTNVLLVDAAGGGIRFGRFYARRARRLIPAASMAIIGVSVTAMLVSSRLDRASIVPDARAASLWYANWHFLASSNDYFADSALESPLLHFWSLAVEEQFYLVFPVVLFAAIRATRGRLKWVAGIFGALLAIGAGLQLWWARADPNHAYLGTDSRVYQPLAGVVLAIALWRFRLPDRRRTGDILLGGAIVGLFALAVAVPGWSASSRGVVATVVAVLAILGGETSPTGWVATALSWRPIRYLGAISYGTYLWHWPIVAFGHRLLELSPRAMFVFSAVLGTGLAALSYEVLEQPIRTATWLRARSVASVGLGVTTAVLVGLVVAPFFLRQSAPPQVRPVATPGGEGSTPVPQLDWSAVKKDLIERGGCDQPDASDCLLRSGSGKTVFVVGDSHAQMWAAAFLDLAERHDWTLYIGFSPSCVWPNGAYLDSTRPINIDQCIERRPRTYEQIDAVQPDIVVLAERGIDDRFISHLQPYRDDYAGLTGEPLLDRSIGDSVDALTAVPGRGVLLIAPIPEVGRDPLDCLSGAAYLEECTFPVIDGFYEPTAYRAAADSSPRVTLVDVGGQICDSVCPPIIDGVVVRRDANHLTDSFVRRFSDQFELAIDQLEAQSTG